MKILFAPDYRTGVPYQSLLARDLRRAGIQVEFLSYYRRILPLTRGIADFRPDVFHMHWPEAYFPAPSSLALKIRSLKYPLDLFFATRQISTVLTVHNILPHNRHEEPSIASKMRLTCRRFDHLIAHSLGCKQEIVSRYGVSEERITIIPTGDLSGNMPTPAPQFEARLKLGIQEHARFALIFGTISPYKGILPVIEWWPNDFSIDLVVVGEAIDPDYLKRVESVAERKTSVKVKPGRVSERDLALWIDAADAAVFNYDSILAPGGVQLALARGIPLLLPDRIRSLDLMEPNALVFRFDHLDHSFKTMLNKAFCQPHDPDVACRWRALTDWETIAHRHADVYRRVTRS